MYGSSPGHQGMVQHLIQTAIGIPCRGGSIEFRSQAAIRLNETGHSSLLSNRLSLVLIDPFGRTVGRPRNQRNPPVKSLGNGRSIIQHGRTGSTNQSYGFTRGQSQSESEKTGGTLIRNHVFLESGIPGERKQKRCISRTGRHNEFTYALHLE